MFVLQTSKNAVYKTLWKKISQDPKNNMVQSSNEGIRKVMTGSYAFIGDKTNLLVEAGKDRRLTFLEEEFFPGKVGMAFPKRSPYTRHFSRK